MLGCIAKQDVNALIAAAAEAQQVYAPIEGDNGVEYLATKGQHPIAYQYVNVKLSPKGLFFPQREVLCTFCHDELQAVPMPDEPFLVFGARPCDVRALLQLDQIFDEQGSRFADPYYVTRRQHALVITLACNAPAATCFCTSVGGSPTDAAGSDILVFELGDELLFETCSAKGEEFMQTYSTFFAPPIDAQLTAKAEQIKHAADTLEAFSIEGLKEKLDVIFEDAVWETLTNPCIGCGACTYVCPTCHCFDVTDETDGRGAGVRLRTWDSCQYPLFTRHASGHNPRVNKKQRMRQRIMHKFSYTVENHDAIFCVGCGRCVNYCPVNLDIREMLQTLSQEA